MSIVASMKRGLIISSFDLLSWLGSFIIAFLTYSTVSSFIEKYLFLGIWTVPLTFVFIITISRLIFDSISYQLLLILPRRLQSNLLNSILGIIPGIINGLVWAAIFSSLLFFVPYSTKVSTEIQESKLAQALIARVYWLQDKLYPVFNDALNHHMQTNPKLSKAETFELPYTVKHPKIRPDLEAQMLVLVNQERTERGLKALAADPEMTRLARKHAADMFARGYFSHISPEGANPFDRMRKENVAFKAAGENLALAQTLQIAHTGLMNSPGHRANILSPRFGRVGIGILDGGIYGFMITQNFRD